MKARAFSPVPDDRRLSVWVPPAVSQLERRHWFDLVVVHLENLVREAGPEAEATLVAEVVDQGWDPGAFLESREELWATYLVRELEPLYLTLGTLVAEVPWPVEVPRQGDPAARDWLTKVDLDSWLHSLLPREDNV